MALDWFRRWKVISGSYTHTDTHTHCESRLSLSLPLLSLSLCHCGPGSVSHKTSWLCVSAGLTGKASQLQIRMHGARRLIGSGFDHGCSVIQGGSPPSTPSSIKFTQTQIHTHRHTRSRVVLGGERIPRCRI